MLLDLEFIFGEEELSASVVGPNDLPGDWRVEWEERAAVQEFDGGFPREWAEAFALRDVLAEMGRVGVFLGNR
jgi:hypothetical protein